MNIDWMPGPTAEARALQLEQQNVLTSVYEAMSGFNLFEPQARAALEQHQPYIDARKRYEETVKQLEQMLGTEAHCNQVDSELWSFYSDCFKSDHGFRPRSEHMTRADVKAAVERMSEKPVDHADY